MSTSVINGFLEEQKAIGIIFISIGILTLLLSFFFLKIIQYSFFKGMAFCFLAAGPVEIAQGYNAVLSCSQTHYEITTAATVLNKEQECFAKKISVIQLCEYICIACLALGCVLFIKFSGSTNVFWKGAGCGVLIQSVAIGLLLFVQEYNLKSYCNSLH